MTRPTVLISGASIAGPALAFWLTRYGLDTTIVERAPAFRSGGQNIDLRGAAREVLRRAGLEEAVRNATTGEIGTRFIGNDGKIVAEFPAVKSETVGPTAELEILRGDLARILVDAGDGQTEYLFGDRIAAIDDTGSEVVVSFDNAAVRRFELVVAADGIGSATRGLVFRNDVSVRLIGMEMTYLTIPRTDTDTDWWRWYNEPGGLGVTLRPDRHGTTRAILTSITYSMSDDGAGAEQRSPAEQEAHLREQFGQVGWEAPRILDALDGPEASPGRAPDPEPADAGGPQCPPVGSARRIERTGQETRQPVLLPARRQDRTARSRAPRTNAGYMRSTAGTGHLRPASTAEQKLLPATGSSA